MPPPSTQAWLLLCLLSLLPLLVTAGEGGDVAPLHSSSAPEQCSVTFDTLKATTWYLNCPPGCLHLTAHWHLNRSTTGRGGMEAGSASVYGRYPYDANSAVCLAAIHSGAIDEAKGGAVACWQFPPQDWSNSSTQTIFPYESWRASYSNGVQSEEVPVERRPVPSPLDAMSWQVSSRGLKWWRRFAPFSPRSGHVHVSTAGAGGVSTLIIGGRNATHRMNDVWLYSEPPKRFGMPRWRRLPDAPFSPRSDAIFYFVTEGTSSAAVVIYVVGGQTADACGLVELGICSNEVWRAWLNTSESVIGDDQPLVWMSVAAPHALLPFVARCDAAFDAPRLNALDPLLVMAGGQLSYNDSSCRSPPLYANHVYYSPPDLTNSSWRQGLNAPFTPRRGMQANRGMVYYDLVNQPVSWLGGVRYLNLTFDSALNRARFTSAVMYADVWMCRLVRGISNNSECQFGWPGADGEVLPIASLPFARSGNIFYVQPSGQQVGAVVSAVSVERWKNTPPKYWTPSSALPPYNISGIIQRVAVDVADNSTWPTRAQLDGDRYGLPWFDRVGEAELNDPEGDFALGSAWVVSSTRLTGRPFMMTRPNEVSGLLTRPSDPSPWQYQAASSVNTTRGLFDFNLRRLDCRGSGSPEAIMVGGRSGQLYYNDWIGILEWGVCAPPTDRSYAPTMGPVAVVSPQAPYFGIGSTVRVECINASFHWEPPSADPEVELFCSEGGVWMDLDHITFRRCVPNTLLCQTPLRDDGMGSCQMPAAGIATIDVAFEGVRRVNVLTLSALPLNQALELTVKGAYFRQPLTVTVGGQDCLVPELRLDAASYSLCPNASQPVNTSASLGCVYGDSFTCVMDSVYGQQLPVRVWSGPSFESVDVLDRTGPQQGTVSTSRPRILNLTSAACLASPDSVYQLTDCPVSSTFELDVWLDSQSVELSQIAVLLDSLIPLDCAVFAVPGSSSQCPVRPNDPCVLARCFVRPHFGQHLLRVATKVGLALSEEPSEVSFQGCQAGTRNDYETALKGDATNLCIPCSPGSSTLNGTGQGWCTVCLPGSHAPVEGSATCLPCPTGYFTDAVGATQCTPCSINSWQHFPGQDRCDACDLDTYIQYSAVEKGVAPPFAPQCLACPARTKCEANGTIWAQAGAYLLIDQTAGTVTSVPCSATACVGGTSGSGMSTNADLVYSSKLPVFNHCGHNRLPALTGGWNSSSGLNATNTTDGLYNVLCAHCLPGYSEVNGVCVECGSINWPLLLSALILLVVCVYAIHRLPHDQEGSGLLTYLSYFAQLSLTFLVSQWMPPMLGLVNLSLLAFHRPYGTQVEENAGSADAVATCILPLSDYGHMGLQLLSPVVVAAVVAVIAGVQLIARRLLSLTSSPIAHTFYRHLFDFDGLGLPCTSEGRLSVSHPVPSDGRSLTAPLMEQPSQPGGGAMEAINAPSSTTRTPASLLYQRTVIRLLQLMYSQLALTSLSFFRLQDVGSFGRRVVDFPQMDPSSVEYAAMRPAVGLVVAFFVCGPPIVMLAFLVCHRHRAAAMELSSVDGVGAVEPSPSPAMVASRAQPLYRQLTLQFQPTRWWWGVSVLLRRLLIASVLVLDRDASVWIWLTCCNYTVLVAHARLWPYRRPRDNWAELLCLFSLALQTTLLSVWPPPIESSVLLTALLLALMVPLLAIVAAAVASRRKGITDGPPVQPAAGAEPVGNVGRGGVVHASE